MSDKPWNMPAAPTGTINGIRLLDEQIALLRANKFAEDRDGVLLMWKHSQTQFGYWKETEMEWRKLSIDVSVEDRREGVNTVPLGNGFELKAGIKFNYNLKSPKEGVDVVDAVNATIDRFEQLDSNEGSFIADRLFKFTVTISVAEYRKLVEEAKFSKAKAAMLKELEKVLEITDAAPTLEIKEPKKGGRK